VRAGKAYEARKARETSETRGSKGSKRSRAMGEGGEGKEGTDSKRKGGGRKDDLGRVCMNLHEGQEDKCACRDAEIKGRESTRVFERLPV
jgi:hypothetical protein